MTLALIRVFKYLMLRDKRGSSVNRIECLQENLLRKIGRDLTAARRPCVLFLSCSGNLLLPSPLKCFFALLRQMLIILSFGRHRLETTRGEKEFSRERNNIRRGRMQPSVQHNTSKIHRKMCQDETPNIYGILQEVLSRFVG